MGRGSCPSLFWPRLGSVLRDPCRLWAPGGRRDAELSESCGDITAPLGKALPLRDPPGVGTAHDLQGAGEGGMLDPSLPCGSSAISESWKGP